MNMQASHRQYLIYMLFAELSIIINLVTQILIKVILIMFLPVFSNNEFSLGKISFENWFLLSLGFGTVAGFIFKFIVDKFVVFQESLTQPTKEELQKTGKQLSLYLGFAILTTMIFWGFEFLFKIFLSGDWYLVGGLNGLINGYTVKFLLDRTFVLTTKK